MNSSEFEEKISELAKTRGKVVAIQEYRRRTSKTLRKCRKDVESILWSRGVCSMSPPRFQFPDHINWHRIALCVIPGIIGLGIAALVIYLNRLLFQT